jgi:hypothetical protein
MQRRALALYSRARSGPETLEQAAVQKRATELRISRVVHGLNAEYFRGEDLEAHAVTRVDPRLELSWNGITPDISVPAERFSARWTGWIKASPGNYKLIIIHDDGVRIWIDGQLVLDKWGGKAGRATTPYQFTGQLQELRIEFHQHDGPASLGLGWIAPGAIKAKAVPNDAFFRDPLPPGPIVEAYARPHADGQIELSAGAAALHGPGLQYRDADPDHVAVWRQLNEWLSWDLEAHQGSYAVDISYGCDAKTAGSTFAVSIGTNRLSAKVIDTGGWNRFQTVRVGQVHLGPGLQSLRIKPTLILKGGVMDLHSIRLTPVNAD